MPSFQSARHWYGQLYGVWFLRNVKNAFKIWQIETLKDTVHDVCTKKT